MERTTLNSRHRILLAILFSASLASIALASIATHAPDGGEDDGGRADSSEVLTILEYGLPYDFEYQSAITAVARRWGIAFRSIAGCIVSDDVIEEAEENNERVVPLIEKRHGAGWRERFDEEVRDEFDRQSEVRDIIGELPEIDRLQDSLGEEGNALHFLMHPIAATERYDAIGIGWGTIAGDTVYSVYYRIIVDRERETIDSMVRFRPLVAFDQYVWP